MREHGGVGLTTQWTEESRKTETREIKSKFYYKLQKEKLRIKHGKQNRRKKLRFQGSCVS